MLYGIALLLIGSLSFCMETSESSSLVRKKECVENEMSEKEAITLLTAFSSLLPELKNNVLSQINYFLIPSTKSFGTVRTIPKDQEDELCDTKEYWQCLREQRRFAQLYQDDTLCLTYNNIPFMHKNSLCDEKYLYGPNKNGLLIHTGLRRAYFLTPTNEQDAMKTLKDNSFFVNSIHWIHALHHACNKWIAGFIQPRRFVEECVLNQDRTVKTTYRAYIPDGMCIVGYDKMDTHQKNIIAFKQGETRLDGSFVVLNINKHLKEWGTDSPEIITHLEPLIELKKLIPQKKYRYVQGPTIQTSNTHPHLLLINVNLDGQQKTYLCDRLANNACIKVFDDTVGFLQCIDTLSDHNDYRLSELPSKLLRIKELPEKYKKMLVPSSCDN